MASNTASGGSAPPKEKGAEPSKAKFEVDLEVKSSVPGSSYTMRCGTYKTIEDCGVSVSERIKSWLGPALLNKQMVHVNGRLITANQVLENVTSHKEYLEDAPWYHEKYHVEFADDKCHLSSKVTSVTVSFTYDSGQWSSGYDRDDCDYDDRECDDYDDHRGCYCGNPECGGECGELPCGCIDVCRDRCQTRGESW